MLFPYYVYVDVLALPKGTIVFSTLYFITVDIFICFMLFFPLYIIWKCCFLIVAVWVRVGIRLIWVKEHFLAPTLTNSKRSIPCKMIVPKCMVLYFFKIYLQRVALSLNTLLVSLCGLLLICISPYKFERNFWFCI